jgi:hypothetical protein
VGANLAFGPYRVPKRASSSLLRYPNRARVIALLDSEAVILERVALADYPGPLRCLPWGYGRSPRSDCPGPPARYGVFLMSRATHRIIHKTNESETAKPYRPRVRSRV